MDDFNYFEELRGSLEEAVAYKKGKTTRCRTVVKSIPIPAYSGSVIANMRRSWNLSQKGLANVLGVSPRTVEAWEAGKNTPSGAAQHLLYLFASDSSLVERLIAR